MKKKKSNQAVLLTSLIIIILIIGLGTVGFILFSREKNNWISNKTIISVDEKDFTFSSIVLFNNKGNVLIAKDSVLKLNGKLKSDKIQFVDLILIENNQEENLLERYNVTYKGNINHAADEDADAIYVVPHSFYQEAIIRWGFSVNNPTTLIKDLKQCDYFISNPTIYDENYNYSYSSFDKNGEYKLNNINNILNIEDPTNLSIAVIIYYSDNTVGEPQFYGVSTDYSKLSYKSPYQHIK